ncbi:hypothetical protein KPATCC21470_0103 [Kitasatospora purpeofusca]
MDLSGRCRSELEECWSNGVSFGFGWATAGAGHASRAS